MLINSFISAFRTFKFNKLFTTINVSSLAIGFTICTLAAKYVINESTYDRYHQKSDRIYRIITDNHDFRGFSKFPITSAPLAPALKEEFPEIVSTVRVNSISWNAIIKTENRNFYEKGWYHIDPEFFQVFSVSFLKGSPSTALSSPNSIVLSESMAMKLFGTLELLGKEVELKTNKNFGKFEISGIIKDFPDNSIFDFKIITNFTSTLKIAAPSNLETWNNRNYHTFVLLQKNVDLDKLAALMPYFRDKYTNDKLDQPGGQRSHFLWQPLSEIHNDTDTAFELKPAVSLINLWIISIVSVIILLLAGINYINLTTAHSLTRAKEIGIRKVAGAINSNLIYQFLIESTMISLMSVILSITLTLMALPYFNLFIGKNLQLNWYFYPSLILCAVLFGVISGIYPALILSKFKPAKILKGYSTQSHGFFLKSFLAILQFSSSAILLIAAFVIQEQLIFIQSKNPGFTREKIMTINWRDRDIWKYWKPLKTELLSIASVEEVSLSSHLPNSITTRQPRKWRLGNVEKTVEFYTAYVDADFVPLFDIELIEGRNFKESGIGEKNVFILNESAVRELELKDPVGMKFIQSDNDTVEIIGVVKDFHYVSVHQQIGPMRLRFLENWISKVSVKFNSGNTEQDIRDLEEVTSKFSPEYPFNFGFFDKQYMNAYNQENDTKSMVIFLTFVALLISCLGLYGLITLNINQRYREIGIRKVLGANKWGLILLLNQRLNILVGLSFAVSAPIAYNVLNSWLSNFAYRIELGISPFLYCLFFLFFVAWTTVLMKSIRASNLNPIQILRHQ